MVRAIRPACRAVFGREPVLLPSGGSIPFVSTLAATNRIDVALLGFGLPDDAIHAPNERFYLPNLFRGTETCIDLYRRLGDGPIWRHVRRRASAAVKAVTAPVSALDPLVLLATGIHAKPGVYAFLLGSGVSTGAGIPTGWGIVQELVRRAAAAHSPGDPGAADAAGADPEAWWSAHGDGQPLGYSNLLAALAPKPAARQHLLAGFFEPGEQDTEAGSKVPARHTTRSLGWPGAG